MKLLVSVFISISAVSCSSAPSALLRSNGSCSSGDSSGFSSELDYLNANAVRYGQFSDDDKTDYTNRVRSLSEEDLRSFVRAQAERQNYRPNSGMRLGAMDWVTGIIGGFRNSASSIGTEGFVGHLVSDISLIASTASGIAQGNPLIGGMGAPVTEEAPPIDHSGGGGGMGGYPSGGGAPSIGGSFGAPPVTAGQGMTAGGGFIQAPSGVTGAANTDALLGSPSVEPTTRSLNAGQPNMNPQFLQPLEQPEGGC